MFISTYNLTVGATGVNMKVKYSERSNGNTVCRGAGYKVFTYNLPNRKQPGCQLEWFGLWVGSTRYVPPRVRETEILVYSLQDPSRCVSTPTYILEVNRC